MSSGKREGRQDVEDASQGRGCHGKFGRNHVERSIVERVRDLMMSSELLQVWQKEHGETEPKLKDLRPAEDEHKIHLHGGNRQQG